MDSGTRLAEKIPSPGTTLAVPSPAAPAPSFWRRAWARWKRFAQAVADFQARLILTVIYFLFLGPYGVLVRAFGDPLNARRVGRPTMWLRRDDQGMSLERAKRQF